MNLKKKKIIVLSVMMGLLILTGFLNVTLSQTSGEVISTSTNVKSGNFFTSYRADRDSARDQEKLYYSAILESASSTQEAKSNATSALNNIAAMVESELYLEGNIKAKGFSDVVVSMSNNFVNVMVSADKLTDAEVAQIVQVVQEQTNKSIDNIKIIPVE